MVFVYDLSSGGSLLCTSIAATSSAPLPRLMAAPPVVRLLRLQAVGRRCIYTAGHRLLLLGTAFPLKKPSSSGVPYLEDDSEPSSLGPCSEIPVYVKHGIYR
jgi:hypothetical protein